jgi:hypothetical protein
MKHVTLIVFAGLLLLLAHAGAGVAQDVSLVGHWVHCDSQKGCLKVAFFPKGMVIAQYPFQEATITARGSYRLRDGVLKLNWSKVTPKHVCVSDPNAPASPKKCFRASQRNMNGPISFDGFNKLTWNLKGGAPLDLVRVLE